MTAIVIVLPLLLGSIQPSTAEEEAAGLLRKAGFFALGGVGIAGETSDEERALRVLVESPRSGMLLESLESADNIETKLYVLVGYRWTKHRRYALLRDQLMQSKARANTFFGCIRSREPVHHLTRRVAAGRFDAMRKRKLDR